MIWDVMRDIPPLGHTPPLSKLDVRECVEEEILEFIGHVRRWAAHLVTLEYWTLEVVSPKETLTIREISQDSSKARPEHLDLFDHGPSLRIRATLRGLKNIPTNCLCPPPVPFPWEDYGFSVGGDTLSIRYTRGSVFDPERPVHQLSQRIKSRFQDQ